MANELESAYRVNALTQNDSNTFTVTRGIWVGTAGNYNITTEDDQDLDAFPLFEGFNAIKIKKWRTGGATTTIYGLY